MKRKIVVWTGFNKNRFGKQEGKVHRSLSEEWISYRFNIWKQYTWQSILRQTYKDWVYCVSCDPEAKEYTDRYFGQIEDKRFFRTYPGRQEILTMQYIVAKGYDEIVNVRIDSDDMYHPKALNELSSALDKSDNNYFVWRNGFAYQYSGARQLKRYLPKHAGPFFAHRYKTKDWLAKKGFKEGQHQNFLKNNPMVLSNNKVIVGIHKDGNSSTSWQTGCLKDRICGSKKYQILKAFGVYQ